MVPAHSQDPSQHQWKNRILLVLASDTLSPEYQQQMEALRSDSEGLDERKLIIYSVAPFGYQAGMDSSEWIHSTNLFRNFHQEGNTHEVILIGLDGSVKHRSRTLTPLAQIFSWIDSMPMRREEIRRKQAAGT
jgi:hypothetical protein